MSTLVLTVVASENKFYSSGCPKVFNASQIKVLGTTNIVPQYPIYLIWNPVDDLEIPHEELILTTHILVDNVIYYVTESMLEVLEGVNKCCVQTIIEGTLISCILDGDVTCGGNSNNGVFNSGYTVPLKIIFSNKNAIKNGTIINMSSDTSLNIALSYVENNGEESFEIIGSSLIILDVLSLPQQISFNGFVQHDQACNSITGQFSIDDIVNTKAGVNYNIIGIPLNFNS